MLIINKIVALQHLLPKEFHSTTNSPLLRVESCVGFLDLIQILVLIAGENFVGNKNYEQLAHISPPIPIMLYRNSLNSNFLFNSNNLLRSLIQRKKNLRIVTHESKEQVHFMYAISNASTII